MVWGLTMSSARILVVNSYVIRSESMDIWNFDLCELALYTDWKQTPIRYRLHQIIMSIAKHENGFVQLCIHIRFGLGIC